MIQHFLRRHLPTLMLLGMLTPVAFALEHPVNKHKFNLPPSADLNYAIQASQSGIKLSGSALVQWQAADNKYSIQTETRAMLIGKLIESRSAGAVDAYGLAPNDFTEKRIRKDPSTTTFNRSSKTISFTQSSETYPIKGGEQDRTSIIWQLIAVARGTPDKFKVGSEWVFFVAGQRDAEPWSFKVTTQESIPSTLGDISAVHVVRAPPPDAKGQQLDIWLAPSLEWYPLRIKFTDPDGNTIEQTLENIAKK